MALGLDGNVYPRKHVSFSHDEKSCEKGFIVNMEYILSTFVTIFL
jgi:hypothetical protein